MNRNLKKVVAIVLTASAFSAVISATNLNFVSTKVYAASGELTSIRLRNSNGTTIKTYSDDDYRNKNKIDDDKLNTNEVYYARTSLSNIKIDVRGVSSSRVRIFKSKKGSTRGIKPSNSIELSSGSTTTLTIRTYNEDPGTVKYSDNSYDSEYVIKVECTASSSDSNTENGEVYLKNIYLSNGDINFAKSTSNYNVNLAESIDEVTITAKPDCDSNDYSDYEVTIDGSTVNEDDKFKKSVSLKKGNNEIKIKVEDDDENKRTYTLNITRGNSSNTTNTTTVKYAQWVVVNGQWQYNDSIGNTVKNAWINNYYLQADGNMSRYWQCIGGYWYYLGSDGAMKTGWQLVNGTWYYLNQQGKMLTGWFKDNNGKYYYLYSNGAMAYSTTINGYKLDSNGVWVR